MIGKITYQFRAKLWKHDSAVGWYLVTLPKNYSDEIRDQLQWQEEGWGRMKASAEIKGVKWDSAIWFDKKSKQYALPVKADIRKKLSIKEGDDLEVILFV